MDGSKALSGGKQWVINELDGVQVHVRALFTLHLKGKHTIQA